MIIRFITTLLLIFLGNFTLLHGQSAKDIIAKSEAQMNGDASYSELKMTIVRPKWSREMRLKGWAYGTKYSLILITAPARDQGTGFLKRQKELWNWQPRIDRVIKMPPSMMMQSWMGSDFSNDDIVQQSSPVDDFTHELMGEETIDGHRCWKIKLIPKPDAPVVWGSIISWVEQEYYLQIKTEFYDEDDYLVNTMIGKDLKMMSGRMVPSVLVVTPADKPGEKTIVEYIDLDFSVKLDEAFFSIQNLKRLQ